MSGHHRSIAAYAMMAVLAFGLTTCKKEKIDSPTVKVFDDVITIGITKANVSAEVTDQGGAEVKSRGFVYGLLGGNLDTVFCGSGTGVYSAELNNLMPNTTYVYEAFAKNIGGIGVSENVTFTTNPLPSFSIVVSANPSNGGVVSGGGSFQEGQPCTIMAMANDGYTFTNWTENDIEVSSNMNYTFVVNSDRTLKANFVVQEPNTYDISVSANPTNGGSVYVGDVPGTTHNIYNQGQSCTVHATANEGYSFTYWTENGQVVTGADADYTFNVTGNRNLEARFTQNDYTINVVARPPQGGTVTGGGVFHYGDQTTLTATANHDYEFHGWDDGITTNPRIITVTSTATYTAVFGEIGTSYYNVYATVDPSGAGYVTGAGPFPAGDTTILKVVPNPGYTFSQWQDGNTQNPRAVIVNSPLSFTAYFTQNQYTIHTYVSPTGTGIVIGGGTYHYGDQPTLSAIANDGYIFDHWSDGVTQNPRQITVTSEATYTAYFTQAPPAQYTITTIVIPDGAGTIEGGGAYLEGTMVTLMAYAFEGYTFDHWQDGSTQNPRNITVIGNATYTAHFTQASSTQYTINVSANPTEGGTVTGGGIYEQGQQCVVEADPNQGYTFIHWIENGNVISTSNRFTFTVSCDRYLDAIFKAVAPNNISANAYPICVEQGYEYPAGVNAGDGEAGPEYGCLSTQKNPAWFFFRMDEPGDMDISIYSSRNPDIDFCCWGPFTDPISPCPNGLTESKIVSCSYSTSDIEHCIIPATAQTGEYYIIVITNYSNQPCGVHFSKVGGSGTSDCSFIVEPPSPNYYSISVSSNPTNGGTVNGGGTYQQGQSCTVSATEATNYNFLNWTENGNQVSTNANYTFTVNADHCFVANFEALNNYTINVSASPSNGGTVSGGGTYQQGQLCTISAVVNNGYVFINWTENGSFVSADANYTFTVNADHTFVANFVVQPQAPVGAINGLFTINHLGDKAFFSRGNLQYKASNGTWHFATNQYDCIGETNANISSTYSGWIDLFGWGTSSWNCGNTYYHPWDSDNSCAGCYGPPGHDLTGSYANSDWGHYNAIDNGGNQIHQWRTLDAWEWYYVFNSRNTTSGERYAKAQVNGVNGVILLPDNWSNSYYTLNNYNSSGASFNSNVISSSTWTNSLEAYGAVFLPAAGRRFGTSVNSVDSGGYYWSASNSGGSYAFSMSFNDGSLYQNSYYRYYGQSVRLVCPAN